MSKLYAFRRSRLTVYITVHFILEFVFVLKLIEFIGEAPHILAIDSWMILKVYVGFYFEEYGA